MTKSTELPWAPVQRWNAHTVKILCPFCEKIHTHGFGDSYSSVTRVAHCRHSTSLSHPSYRFHYPFSATENTAGYEIDKVNGFYVALGADTSRSEVDALDEDFAELTLATDESSRCWESATETITLGIEDGMPRCGEDTYAMKKLDYVVSLMVGFGDRDFVEQYVRTSSEVNIFLSGTDEAGDSALNLAARERYPDIVELLLDNGAAVDHQNQAGRSPLMEAALWARIENVKHLLQHGANRDLRDRKGRRAADFAKSSQLTDEERHQRSAGVYKEDTFIANQARRVIFELLKQPEEHLSSEIGTRDPNFRAHSFQRTDAGTIALIAPVAYFPVPNEWKTIATLERPDSYPKIAAMSGWGHGETKVTVSGRDWTDEVMGISTTVRHQLRDDERRDQGTPGQFCASHAEKQLVAYFISKHVLVESQDDVLLLKAKPPVSLRGATILVSRPPCEDCSQFINAVNCGLDLRIDVLDRSE